MGKQEYVLDITPNEPTLPKGVKSQSKEPSAVGAKIVYGSNEKVELWTYKAVRGIQDGHTTTDYYIANGSGGTEQTLKMPPDEQHYKKTTLDFDPRTIDGNATIQVMLNGKQVGRVKGSDLRLSNHLGSYVETLLINNGQNVPDYDKFAAKIDAKGALATVSPTTRLTPAAQECVRKNKEDLKGLHACKLELEWSFAAPPAGGTSSGKSCAR